MLPLVSSALSVCHLVHQAAVATETSLARTHQAWAALGLEALAAVQASILEAVMAQAVFHSSPLVVD
jgi:arsenate reductase-like glutaredoxin family protein